MQVLYMNDPPYYRYILSHASNVSYSEYELIRSQKKKERVKIRAIIDDKNVGRKRFFKVWWKGELKKQATWEPEKILREDGVGPLIDAYLEEN
jgi:hypothetical protein